MSRRLPPAVRVLDQALQLTNAQQRLQLLQKALAGGQGELPGVDMDSLSATCGQFIDDMEDQEVGHRVQGLCPIRLSICTE